jgi:NAD(P)H dehydrogenase (quinone)
MKVLVVYAHPNPLSFNNAVLSAFRRGLDDGGHDCEVVDLYKIDFDPRFKQEDFAQFTGGPMPEDVREQQRKVAWADAMAFISPIWWMGFPAILKGWGERVFSNGFAYRLTREGWQGNTLGRIGLLSHRKVLIVNTTFFSEKDYEATGLKDAVTKTMEEWAFRGSGVPEIQHVYYYGVYWVDDPTRKAYLKSAYELGKEF